MSAKKPVERKKSEIEIETKLAPISLEALSEADGSFSGLAIPFDSPHDSSSWQLDGWQDTVAQGAFTDTLAAHKAAGTMPLLQWMHQRGNIIGTITSAKQTPEGVKVEGKVSPNAVSPSGVPVLELLRTKAVSGLSIGFRPTQVSLDEKTKIRTIEGVDWAELSVVDIPGAGPDARVTDIKSDPRSFESELVSRMGLSRREAKALMSEGYAAIARAPAPPAPAEELAATKVSRLAAADSDAANESSDAAGTAHGATTVAHAKAAADHAAASHSNTLASKQAADKGNADGAAEFKAAADMHDGMAGRHNAAAAAMQACYQTKAAPAPAPIHVESVKPGEVQALVKSIKDSLSPRDADGKHRDGAQGAGSIWELANNIIDTLKGQ